VYRFTASGSHGVFVLGALAWMLVCAGCYASHEQRAEGGELCEGPTYDVGDPCGGDSSAVPEGVCRLADGTTIAFAELDSSAGCQGGYTSDSDILQFFAYYCTAERPRGRAVVACPSTTETPSFSGEYERPAITYDLSEVSCALTQPMDGEPAGPWEPFGAPRALCSDPYAWCGSPMVLELVHAAFDGCGGSDYTHRCTAHVEGERIVLRAETAPEASLVCETILTDRIARCIVPPLPAGRYEVVDETARVLGSVVVPGERPTGELEPTCTPL
jgi:hypothetical protein